MKKSLFLAAALCGSMAANAALSDTNFQDNNYVQEWGRLKLVGNQLSSEKGEAIQLKGWSTFSINYGEVMPCLSVAAWDAMKYWGANIVRIAIYPKNANGSYSQSDDDRIMKYINWCNERGMYALVDWHVLDCDNGAGSGNPHASQNLEPAKGMFERITKQVKEAGLKNVLYEICNEPSGVDWKGKNNNKGIKEYAEESILPIIAKNDPGAIVIVGTPEWDQRIGDAVNDQINKTKFNLGIMYAFHYYACSHGHLLSAMTAAAANVPVFISEWGSVRFDGGGLFCEEQSNQFLSYLEKNGNSGNQLISWCYWAWGAKNETSNCLKSCGGSYNPDVLTQAGKYIVGVLTGKTEIKEVPQSEYWEKQQIPVPNKDYGFLNVAYFDKGGELVAYHDANSTMYCTIDKEVDRDCIDENGVEAKCANAGAYYGAWQTHSQEEIETCFRWDEDVDITNSTANLDGSYASGIGDGMGNTDFHNLCHTEPGEWIMYTIDVKKKGYYRMYVCTNKNTSSKGSIGLAIAKGTKPGQNGTIARSLKKYNQEGEHKLVSIGLSGSTQGRLPDGTNAGWNGTDKNDVNLSWGWVEAGGRAAADMCALFKYEGEQKLLLTIDPEGTNLTPGDFSNVMFEYISGMEIPEFEYVDSEEEEEEESDKPSYAETEVMSQIGVCPNPSNGDFTVKVADAAANVTVYNAVGAVVFNKDVNNDVTVKGLNAGIYTVRVSTAAGVKTIKAIVK